MKKPLVIFFALVILAVFAFWILPTALHLIFSVALLTGAAYAVYIGVRFYRRREQNLTARQQSKTERRVHKSAEKSLEHMERALKAGGSSDADFREAAKKQPR